MNNSPKRAAVINDLSGMGRCSLTASIAVLSAMGISPCSMPTAVLSHQTAFKSFYSLDLTESMRRFSDEWQKSGETFDGIISGYVAGERQFEVIAEFIDRFKTDGTIVTVDPVLGDGGELYPACGKSTVEGMKKLAEKADLLTPNLTELCLLTDSDYSAVSNEIGSGGISEVVKLAKRLQAHDRQKIAVTGIALGDEIHNVYIDGGSFGVIKSKRIGGYFSGTGDIFSSVVFGCLMSGDSMENAVKTSSEFITAAIKNTVNTNPNPLYGVNFESELHRLIRK